MSKMAEIDSDRQQVERLTDVVRPPTFAESVRAGTRTHTPLPWRTDEPAEELDTLTRILSPDGIMLVHAHSYPKYSTKHPDADARRANAAFIVKAVNAHDGLITALTEAAERLEARGHKFGAEQARTAITRATGAAS